MTLPTLDPLWRTTPDDRELIREYANFPGSEAGMTMLTVQLNSLASVTPSTVARVKGWIDEIQQLEQDVADQVADRTAHLGDVKSYEGLRPGLKPTKDDTLTKAGPLEWDTQSLMRVRFEAGDGPGGTASGQTQGRIADLKGRILTALSLSAVVADPGTFMIERS